jgi:flagellar biosynthetic protein FliR
VTEVLVTAFTLTLARTATFISVLPLVGGANTPAMVKAGLALLLSVLFFNDASAALMQNPQAAAALTTWLGLGMALGREILLGAVLGFALGLFLLPAHVAAEFITQESGLSFANVVTATGTDSSNALTVVFELLASLVYFALDLHHVFLLLLQETFQHMPIGREFALPNWDFAAAAGRAEEGGLLLAAPVALCLFLTTVVLALMVRAAPQLNLYSIGFPLRVLVCLGAVLLLMPQLIVGMTGYLAYFINLLHLGG